MEIKKNGVKNSSQNVTENVEISEAPIAALQALKIAPVSTSDVPVVVAKTKRPVKSKKVTVQTVSGNTFKINQRTIDIFMSYAKDAKNCGGTPPLSNNQDEQGNISHLKKVGFIITNKVKGGEKSSCVVFTSDGVAFAKQNGVEIPCVSKGVVNQEIDNALGKTMPSTPKSKVS